MENLRGNINDYKEAGAWQAEFIGVPLHGAVAAFINSFFYGNNWVENELPLQNYGPRLKLHNTKTEEDFLVPITISEKTNLVAIGRFLSKPKNVDLILKILNGQEELYLRPGILETDELQRIMEDSELHKNNEEEIEPEISTPHPDHILKRTLGAKKNAPLPSSASNPTREGDSDPVRFVVHADQTVLPEPAPVEAEPAPVEPELAPIQLVRSSSQEDLIILTEVASRVEQDFPEQPNLTDLIMDPRKEGLLSALGKTFLNPSSASENFDSDSRLVLQKHTGPAKAIYTYGNLAITTHKQIEAKNELEKDFRKTVEIRVSTAQKKLSQIIEDESWQFQSQDFKRINTQINEVCKIYRNSLMNTNETNSIVNFTTFLNIIYSDNMQISQENKEKVQAIMSQLYRIQENKKESEINSELSEREKGLKIAEKIDESLKYIDVEKVMIIFNGRNFYKSRKPESNLNYFIETNVNRNLDSNYGHEEFLLENLYSRYKLNNWQLHKLAQSFDEISKTLQSLKIVHGDIKPGNIDVYKITEKDNNGNDVDAYYMKITNFAKSTLDPSMLYSSHLTNQTKSIYLMKLMLLTTRGYAKPLSGDEFIFAGKQHVNNEKLVDMFARYESRKWNWINWHEKAIFKELDKAHEALKNLSEAHQESRKNLEHSSISEDVQHVLDSLSELEYLKNLLNTPLGAYLYIQKNLHDDRNDPNYVRGADRRDGSFDISSKSYANTLKILNDFISSNLSKRYQKPLPWMADEYVFLDLDILKNDLECIQTDLMILETYASFAGNTQPKYWKPDEYHNILSAALERGNAILDGTFSPEEND